MERAVLLDRDGVINAMWYDADHGLIDSPTNPDQFVLLPGVVEAIHLINQLGLLTVVVSNQPGIAKGKLNLLLLEAINKKMLTELDKGNARLDGIFYCFHHPDALLKEYRCQCNCRKPRPGLLEQASQSLGLDLSKSYMIGDGINDIQAGKTSKCHTIWIGHTKCENCQIMAQAGINPDMVAENLLEAVQLIRSRG